ncbi:MAG: hypothetical protein HY356_02745 [Gammaproteobacteria bacterium]|nr:hypothetical protein [Gammaproteobacteria bacterium]
MRTGRQRRAKSTVRAGPPHSKTLCSWETNPVERPSIGKQVIQASGDQMVYIVT